MLCNLEVSSPFKVGQITFEIIIKLFFYFLEFRDGQWQSLRFSTSKMSQFDFFATAFIFLWITG